MSKLIPVSEAKAKLNVLLREAEDDDVVLLRHGRPAGVLISPDRLEALIARVEDAEDRLSVYERENMPVGLDKLKAELGLSADDS